MRTALLALLVFGTVALAPRAAGAVVGEVGPGVIVEDYASGQEAPSGSAIMQPATVYAAATGTHFEVTYIDFPADAREAVQYAVTIWEALIVSPVDIVVEVTWADMQPGLWASAGFEFTFRNFPGAPMLDTWYPIPVANALAGVDLLPGEADIVAKINKNTNWYLGTDGQPPPGTADLVTLMLHELAHGLGFGATFDVFTLLGKWRAGEGAPLIYERYVENVLGKDLIETALFPNPSIALGTELTGGSLYFSGPQATAANNGARPRLYAPAVWNRLSSVQHLNEDTYPTGDENSLMTPFFDFAEVTQVPGPVVMGMLRDIGWETAAPEACLEFGAGSLGNGTVQLTPHASPGCAPGFFAPGEVVTLVATAGEGWTLFIWTLNVGAVACMGCATTVVTMPITSLTAIATFDDSDYAERLVVPQAARAAAEP